MEITRDNLFDTAIRPIALNLADNGKPGDAEKLVDVYIYITALEFAIDRSDGWAYFNQANDIIAKRLRDRGLI